MKITFAHLCDYATISREGKLSVMGIFSRVRVDKFPYRLASAFLVFEIEAEAAELPRPALIELQCRAEDGADVFRLTGTMQVPQAMVGKTPPGRRPRIYQVLGVHGLTLSHAGGHSIHIFVNHDLKHTIEFEVEKVGAGGGGGGGSGVFPPRLA